MMETETGIEIGGERGTEIWAGTGDKDKGRGMIVVKIKIEEEEEITILTTINFCQINCGIYLLFFRGILIIFKFWKLNVEIFLS